MSDSTAPSSLANEVGDALAVYDRTHAPDDLRHAGDVLVRDDGDVPPDPATALTRGFERLHLWLDVFARFHRDLPADFDPKHPPSRTITAPVIDGEQVPPWVGPEDIKDPVARKQFEDAIKANDLRVAQFTLLFKLSAVHAAMVERAVASLRDARATLGLPAADIAAALDGADMSGDDRAALRAAAD